MAMGGHGTECIGQRPRRLRTNDRARARPKEAPFETTSIAGSRLPGMNLAEPRPTDGQPGHG